MVNAKTVVAKFIGARVQWSKIDKDWVAHVRDEVNGGWTFEVLGKDFPTFTLQMKSPGGKSAPAKGTYQFKTTYRSAEEAKAEANFWIADVEKGGGINSSGHWKKI